MLYLKIYPLALSLCLILSLSTCAELLGPDTALSPISSSSHISQSSSKAESSSSAIFSSRSLSSSEVSSSEESSSAVVIESSSIFVSSEALLSSELSSSSMLQLGNITVVSPGLGEVLTETEVTLTWSGAETSQLMLLIDSFSPPVHSHSVNVGESSITLEGLEFGTQYYWELMGYNERDTVMSSVFSFEIDDEPIQHLVERVRESVYLIGFLIDGKIYGVGTGFAIGDSTIMTNAHVVEALTSFFKAYDMSDIPVVAVKDGGIVFGDGFHKIDAYRVHSQYDTASTFTYDFGLLRATDGGLDSVVTIARNIENSIEVGDDLITIGFPGETNQHNYVSPLATFKRCNISTLRPFDSEDNAEHKSSVIQHDCNTTGGTSGSPLFNKKGEVIGVHNSGVYTYVLDGNGEYERIPVGSQSYGIRYDKSEGIEKLLWSMFDDIPAPMVTYALVNRTGTSLKIKLNGVPYQTIYRLDSLILVDTLRNNGTKVVLTAESTTLTGRDLVWTDTLYIGLDNRKIFEVTSPFFLLVISAYSSGGDYSLWVEANLDTYDVFYEQYTMAPVGYYRCHIYTNILILDNVTEEYKLWEQINTCSLDDKLARQKFLTFWPI